MCPRDVNIIYKRSLWSYTLFAPIKLKSMKIEMLSLGIKIALFFVPPAGAEKE
jgi:hypothetical protein